MRMWFPKVFISALDKIGMDVKNQSADFFYLFSPAYGIRMQSEFAVAIERILNHTG